MTQPKVAVIDYGIGNLRSAEKALQRVGADAALCQDPDEIGAADAVVLPGVGNYGRCIAALHEAGLVPATLEAAHDDRPFLGICVGMQMLFEASDESPNTPGLGVLAGRVELLPDTVKRPQMQWNRLSAPAGNPLIEPLDGQWMYFVHSYAVRSWSAAVTTCDYGGPVVAAVAQGSLVATQFHPEKSGRDGLALLDRFVAAIPVGVV